MHCQGWIGQPGLMRWIWDETLPQSRIDHYWKYESKIQFISRNRTIMAWTKIPSKHKTITPNVVFTLYDSWPEACRVTKLQSLVSALKTFRNIGTETSSHNKHRDSWISQHTRWMFEYGYFVVLTFEGWIPTCTEAPLAFSLWMRSTWMTNFFLYTWTTLPTCWPL